MALDYRGFKDLYCQDFIPEHDWDMGILWYTKLDEARRLHPDSTGMLPSNSGQMSSQSLATKLTSSTKAVLTYRGHQIECPILANLTSNNDLCKCNWDFRYIQVHQCLIQLHSVTKSWAKRIHILQSTFILYDYMYIIYHGPPKPKFLEVFMVNNLVFRWPKPLFFMVLGAHGTL